MAGNEEYNGLWHTGIRGIIIPNKNSPMGPYGYNNILQSIPLSASPTNNWHTLLRTLRSAHSCLVLSFLTCGLQPAGLAYISFALLERLVWVRAISVAGSSASVGTDIDLQGSGQY